MIRAAALLLALAAPATAQTFPEAVRLNAALATSLCLDAMLTGSAPAPLFTSAGFTYRAIDRGVNSNGVKLGLDHYFDAPADTAKAEVVNPNTHPGLCQVLTTHMTEAEFSQVVAGVIFRKHPGATVRSAREWYVTVGGGLPLIVTVSTITRHKYETPGTVIVSMSFPG